MHFGSVCCIEFDTTITKRGLYEEKPGQTEFLGSLTFLEVPITFARRPEHNVLVAEKENDHFTLCHNRKC